MPLARTLTWLAAHWLGSTTHMIEISVQPEKRPKHRSMVPLHSQYRHMTFLNYPLPSKYLACHLSACMKNRCHKTCLVHSLRYCETDDHWIIKLMLFPQITNISPDRKVWSQMLSVFPHCFIFIPACYGPALLGTEAGAWVAVSSWEIKDLSLKEKLVTALLKRAKSQLCLEKNLLFVCKILLDFFSFLSLAIHFLSSSRWHWGSIKACIHSA